MEAAASVKTTPTIAIKAANAIKDHFRDVIGWRGVRECDAYWMERFRLTSATQDYIGIDKTNHGVRLWASTPEQTVELEVDELGLFVVRALGPHTTHDKTVLTRFLSCLPRDVWVDLIGWKLEWYYTDQPELNIALPIAGEFEEKEDDY